jgi:hypothetical protein
MGCIGAGERSVHLLALDMPELPDFRLPTTHFTCFVATDFGNPAAGRLLQALMKKGAMHVTGWGPGSGRVASTVQAEDCPVPWPVKAIWFEHAPLAKAVWSFLNNTYPDDTVDTSCRSALAVIAGRSDWAREVRRLLIEAREESEPKIADLPAAKPSVAPITTPDLLGTSPTIGPVQTVRRFAPVAPVVARAPAAPGFFDSPEPSPPQSDVAGEQELCRRLLVEHHLAQAERATFPHLRVRFSVLKEIVADTLLATSWFPLRLELAAGSVIESREGQIWVHEQTEGLPEVRSRRVASISDAVRAYLRYHGDPGGNSIDGLAIDWGA